MKNKKIIIKEFEVCNTFFSKLIGLMFRKNIKKPLLFILDKKEVGIHSLFVFFSFDAIFLDENKVVVDVKPNIRPFSLLITPKKRAKFLIEAEAGFIYKNNIQIGDEFEW